MMWLRKPIQLTVHFLKIVGSFFTDVRVGFSLASFDSNTSPLNRIYTYKSLLHVKYFTFPIFRPKGRNSCPTADLNAYRCLGDEVQRTLCHGLKLRWAERFMTCLSLPQKKGSQSWQNVSETTSASAQWATSAQGCKVPLTSVIHKR
jgi:hypothetical protein